MSRAQQPPVRTPSWKKSARDMLLSLAVIMAAVAVIYLLVPRADRNLVPEVDLAAAASAARSAGLAPVIEPPTPQGWTVTSARLDRAANGLPATWQVGYLTDDDRYAAMQVTAEASDDWLADETADGHETGTMDVAGQQWRTFVGRDDGRTYLVRSEPGRTTVVGGSAALDDLVALAELVDDTPVT